MAQRCKRSDSILCHADSMQPLPSFGALDRGPLPAGRFEQLIDVLYTISTTRRMVLQWVPVHWTRGLPGKEAIDQLAKTGASHSQPDSAPTYGKTCSVIRSARKPSAGDDYHRFSWREQVIFFSGLEPVTTASIFTWYFRSGWRTPRCTRSCMAARRNFRKRPSSLWPATCQCDHLRTAKRERLDYYICLVVTLTQQN